MIGLSTGTSHAIDRGETGGHVADLVQRAGELGTAPGAGVAHVGDDVGHALAAIGKRERSKDRRSDAEQRKDEVVVDAALKAVLERQGGREAVAEREGVGEQVDVGVRRIVEAQVTEVRHRQIRIGEERRDAAGGEACRTG